MGKGGSEQRAATSFPGDCRDPGDLRGSRNEFQMVQIIYVFLKQKLLGPHAGGVSSTLFGGSLQRQQDISSHSYTNMLFNRLCIHSVMHTSTHVMCMYIL